MRTLLLAALLLAGCATLPHVDRVAISRGLSAPDPCGYVFADGVVRLGHSLAEPTLSWCDSGRLSEMLLARAATGAPPVHLVGHSLGANAAMQVAHFLRRHGAPVGKIFLLDPTVATDMTGFDATAFLSRDIRARAPKGATIIRRPDLRHVALAEDPAIHVFILERIGR